MVHNKGHMGIRRQQGRGSTGRKLPVCHKCKSAYLVALYAQETVPTEGKRKWIKKGYFCNNCEYFEPVKDSEMIE
ncbi:hypothetical protein [Methanolobus bombayensis]|uniref:hypothetical protein n=1 Tax=Methanolobus bombayensis TaxID=38023 RepID=UPI001AE31024|nr:hypothetical protein [Methanolobus bombayensis]MBP1910165.1 hypothetical protein [Methanolobus bombayensis]